MDTSAVERSLCELASSLEVNGLVTRLEETPRGLLLRVRNESAGNLNETIRVQDEQFLWSWGQVIAPIADTALAVERICRVLATVEG